MVSAMSIPRRRFSTSQKAFHIDRRKIQLDEPLKALGVYEVPIKLHPEVEVKIKVWVVKE